VFATVPHSAEQQAQQIACKQCARQLPAGQPAFDGPALKACGLPALQFAMLDARNNVAVFRPHAWHWQIYQYQLCRRAGAGGSALLITPTCAKAI
jgi:hypothetical protein